MSVKVYYMSTTGSTKTIAKTIASECQCAEEALFPAYMPEDVSIMFMGCEGMKADEVTMDFISRLNLGRVKNAALFNCNLTRSENAIEQMRAVLEDRGIHVLPESLVLPGRGILLGRMPNAAELDSARHFAAKCLQSVGEAQ